MQVDPFTVRPILPSQKRHLLELLRCPSCPLAHGGSGHRSPTPAPIKRPTMSDEGPDRAGHLVRECYDRDVLGSSRQHTYEPRSITRSARLCDSNTLRAPWISSVLKYGSPHLLMPSN